MNFKKLIQYLFLSFVVVGLLAGCGGDSTVDTGDQNYIELLEDISGNANNINITADQLNAIEGISGAVDGVNYTDALMNGEYADPLNPTAEEVQGVVDIVNTEVPILEDSTGNVAENALSGTIIGRVSIVSTGASEITDMILTGEGNENFEVAVDGTITVSSSASLDFETTPLYNLTVKAISPLGNSNNVSVTITVTYVDEDAPVFTSLNSATVAENQTSVITLEATDENAITYSISGTDAESFTVNETTGVVTFITAPDYESKQSYEFIAEATDNAGNKTTQLVTITITNIADVTPTLSNSNGIVSEDVREGTNVGTVTITSSGDSAISEITLSGTGSENFEVATDGTITVKAGANIDYETAVSYSLNAIAINNAGNSDSVIVTITVTNVVDNVPVLNTPANETFAEDVATADTTITTVTTDGSNDDENTVTSYAITSGNTNGDFAISSTGVITTVNALDYETTTSYNLTVKATNDAGDSSTVSFSVTVTNIVDNVPVLATTSEVDIIEESEVGVVVTKIVVNGMNSDENTTDSFTITNGNTDNDFSIDENGEITLANTLSGERTIRYSLTILATNEEGNSSTIEQVINVKTIPTASDFNLTLDVNMSIVDGDWVALSMANDLDGDTLTAIVKTQGTYGEFTVAGNVISYHKNTETNLTDTGVLTITDGENTLDITVTLISLYWKQVFAGGSNGEPGYDESAYSIGIKSNGTLWSWGSNDSGQLGDGTTVDKINVPVQIGSDNNWRMVTAGFNHNLAINTLGELWAWGNNKEGKLGDTTTLNRNTPVQIGTDINWTTASAGRYHTLAISSIGELYAWGLNANGQLGDGTTTNSSEPIKIGSSSDWKIVSAGAKHSTAINSAKELYTWGWNIIGQLGDGTTTDRDEPTNVGSGIDWTIVSAGNYFNLAISDDGELYAWGHNYNGQLGDGTTDNKNTPTQIGSSTNWSNISAGDTSSFALNTENNLYAWGNNQFGQLGDGTTIDQNEPKLIANDSNLTTIFAGYNHTLSINNVGELFTWGSNPYGELGNGLFASSDTPLNIENNINWSAVSGGDNHSVAINEDGELYAWGLNGHGQLGIGTEGNEDIPMRIGNSTDWTMTSSGKNFSCAIDNEGALYAWGQNSYGQLGDNTTTSKDEPVEISGQAWNMISTGDYFTLGITTSGELYAWGRNNYGQLGIGGTDNKKTPVQVGTATNWTVVSAGGTSSYAINDLGDMYAWGRNNYGQLGNGTTDNKDEPILISDTITWLTVAAGRYHSLALNTDNKLYAWGLNGHGGLGDGTTDNRDIPTSIGSESNWVSISAGERISSAINNSNELYTWGYNYYGQLGDRTKEDKHEPTKIEVGTDWSTISVGYSHMLAINSGNKLYAWGNNEYGQLGDDSFVFTPTKSQPRQP